MDSHDPPHLRLTNNRLNDREGIKAPLADSPAKLFTILRLTGWSETTKQQEHSLADKDMQHEQYKWKYVISYWCYNIFGTTTHQNDWNSQPSNLFHI